MLWNCWRASMEVCRLHLGIIAGLDVTEADLIIGT